MVKRVKKKTFSMCEKPLLDLLTITALDLISKELYEMLMNK